MSVSRQVSPCADHVQQQRKDTLRLLIPRLLATSSPGGEKQNDV